MDDKKLTLVEHLEELRGRIIKSLVVFLLCTAGVYNFTPKVIPLLAKPVKKLIFIAPQEAFITYIKVSLLLGFFLSSPFILYEIWKFIATGLMPRERRYILIFAPLSFIFFILGSCFAYFIVVPLGIRFLLGFANDFVTPMITISKYVSFVTMFVLIFGIVFELPLIILFLTKLNIVTPQFLRKKRKHMVVLIFILAALFTPPDVVTQLLLSFPLLLLYEMGVFLSKIAYASNK
jgi:sec-independent protein translocase protein TatC